jgi:hypothetical protein
VHRLLRTLAVVSLCLQGKIYHHYRILFDDADEQNQSHYGHHR